MESFITKLSPIDLYARTRGQSPDHRHNYLQKYLAPDKQRSSFTNDQLIKLQNAIKLANEKIQAHVPNLFIGLPWNLCKVDVDVEQGMPHTHGKNIYYSDLLFQSSIEEIAEILIHERIHVLQRILPGVFHDMYIHLLGYEHYPQNFQTKLQRSNPDTFDFPVYTFQGRVLIMEYNSINPSSLHDCTLRVYDPTSGLLASESESTSLIRRMQERFPNVHQLEHPNEVTACMIAKMIMNSDNLLPYDRIYQWLIHTEFKNVESEA